MVVEKKFLVRVAIFRTPPDTKISDFSMTFGRLYLNFTQPEMLIYLLLKY